MLFRSSFTSSSSSTRPISPAVPAMLSSAAATDVVSLLTAEELDLEKDPVLARAVSPLVAVPGGGDGSPSSLREQLKSQGQSQSPPSHLWKSQGQARREQVGQQMQTQDQRAGHYNHQVKWSAESGVGLGPSLTRARGADVDASGSTSNDSYTATSASTATPTNTGGRTTPHGHGRKIGRAHV